MKRLIISLIFILFIVSPAMSKDIKIFQDSVEMKYDTSLQKIVKIHDKIKTLYTVLEKLQPIAIVENGNFYIFDTDENSNYKFIKKSPVSFPIPVGIRAAMPLDSYGFKSVCVVTGDAFDNFENILLIFHEFVHCAQFQTVEMSLKEKMKIYKQAMEKMDYMWEINYSFPYTNKDFVKAYADFIDALENKDTAGIKAARIMLKIILSDNEYEYMTWQEWKEGYARYVENKLQNYFSLTLNEYGKSAPFNRISFYAGGSKYIDCIISGNPKLENDLEAIYKKIFDIK
jgi:hypothetical protein